VRLLCSSMTRAIQTIRPLARELGLRPLVSPEVHEVQGFFDTSGKVVQGMGRAEIMARFPEFDAPDIPEAGQSGESAADALRRARALADALREAATNAGGEEVVVLVSHNDFICMLARQLLQPSEPAGAAPGATGPGVESFQDLFTESYWPMNNTGVSHFILGARPPAASSYPAKTWLVYWNRSDHLLECERSGVQFKNVGLSLAAEWARVGAGGSGLKPKFDERKAVRIFQPAWVALATAALAVAALMSLRRHV